MSVWPSPFFCPKFSSSHCMGLLTFHHDVMYLAWEILTRLRRGLRNFYAGYDTKEQLVVLMKSLTHGYAEFRDKVSNTKTLSQCSTVKVVFPL